MIEHLKRLATGAAVLGLLAAVGGGGMWIILGHPVAAAATVFVAGVSLVAYAIGHAIRDEGVWE